VVITHVNNQLSDPAKTKITAHHFNKGKGHAAQGSKVNQMEAKEHDSIFNDSDGELEAKQHDPVFDDSEGEEETAVEANTFETVQVSDAVSARKMHEDEGVDFDMMLQAPANKPTLASKHALTSCWTQTLLTKSQQWTSKSTCTTSEPKSKRFGR